MSSRALPREPENRPVPGSAPVTKKGTELLFWAFLLLMAIEYLGLSQLVPPLQAMRLPTMLAWGLSIAMLWKVGMRAFTEYPQSRLLLGLVFFTGLTMLYAEIQMVAFTTLRSHLDYFGLFVATAYLIDRPKRIGWLTLVFSVIPVVMVVRNADKLTSSLRQGAMQGAYFTGDGNDFGWLLVLTLPLTLYPIVTRQGKLARLIGLIGAVACLAGIIGTQSRGATLALAAALLYYWLYITTRKMLAVVALTVGVLGVVVFAPSAYMERMSTVENYQEDASAMSRLKMWGIATQMAIDYPLGVGAGNFSAAYGRIYLPRERSGGGWGATRWLSAHSVYFRALGEYGFLGLTLVLTIIVVNYRANHRTREVLRASGPAPGQISEKWPSILNMSLVGYAVAGTFLGGLAYPHLYVLSALTVSARRQAELARTASVAAVDTGREAPLLTPARSRRLLVPTARPMRANSRRQGS